MANKPKLSEADVQRAVVDMLATDGWRPIRTDPVSDRSRGKGFGEVGMPDYLFIRYRNDSPLAVCDAVRAEVLWIEFKAPGKKLKPHQIRWTMDEARSGAMVKVCDDIDAFKSWYLESGLNRRIVA